MIRLFYYNSTKISAIQAKTLFASFAGDRFVDAENIVKWENNFTSMKIC